MKPRAFARRDELPECRGWCLFVFVPSVLPPGLTQKPSCGMDGLADCLAFLKFLESQPVFLDRNTEPPPFLLRKLKCPLRQSSAILLKPQSDHVTLLVLTYGRCVYLCTALRRADVFENPGTRLLPLRFLFQQQQCDPFFFRWPRMYKPMGPQTPSENFCPQPQSKLLRVNRAPFGWVWESLRLHFCR